MNIHRCWHQILIMALFVLVALPLRARERADTALLHRVFHYAATVDTTHMQGYATYAYNRFTIDIDKKNPLLMLVITGIISARLSPTISTSAGDSTRMCSCTPRRYLMGGRRGTGC